MKRALIAALVLPAAALVTTVTTVTTAPASGDTPPANAAKCHTAAPADFNGDGYSDLAISAPGANDHADSTGLVDVLAGGKSGLTRAGTLSRHEDGSNAAYPAFGSATATGDFNGDGCADLVVLDDGGRSGKSSYGAATIYYGRRSKNLATGFGYQQLIKADAVHGIGSSCNTSSGCPVGLQPVVAAGDVNGDGYADLLVASASTIDHDGLAYDLSIVSGSKTGLHPGTHSASLPLGTKLFPGTEPTSEIQQIVVGDINHDGYEDVAVGFTGGNDDKPGVDVLYGAKKGLGKGRASQLWDRDKAGVPGSDDGGTNISLTLGDFRGNGYDDLAFAEAGSPKVTVVYGTSKGLTTKHIQSWSKESPGIKGSTAKQGDVWGSSMVAGRFGIAKYDDLVVGDTGTRQISVLKGSAAHGLVATDNQLWQAGKDGIPGTYGPGTYWSGAMTVGYFGHGLGEDLAIGAKYANGTRGTVTILYGTKNHAIGLSTAHAQPLLKASDNAKPAAPGDEFGAALDNSGPRIDNV